MFDVVKDCYNTYDDNLKKIKLKDLSAIYIQPNKKTELLFERFDNFWTYENMEGKFNYEIDNEQTFEFLIEQLKNNYEFDDNFMVRCYGYDINKNINKQVPSYIKMIIPNNRKHINQEIFGNFELERMYDVHLDLYKDKPEILNEFKKQFEIVAQDVLQIVRIISAQAHSDSTLSFTMKLVSQILSSYPLTPITDEEKFKDDWIDLETIDQSNSNKFIKSLCELEDKTIKNCYLNVRCSRIFKVIYVDKDNNETTEYYDLFGQVFIDTDTNESYISKDSVISITLPWNYTNMNEIEMTEDMKKDKDSMRKTNELDIF